MVKSKRSSTTTTSTGPGCTSDNLKWTLSRVLPNTYGNRVNVNATHNAGEGWAELLKSVNNKSRGLPNQYPLPDDDGDGDA